MVTPRIVGVGIKSTIVRGEESLLKLKIEDFESEPHRGVNLFETFRQSDFQVASADQRACGMQDCGQHMVALWVSSIFVTNEVRRIFPECSMKVNLILDYG